jgi:hypothetical protein
MAAAAAARQLFRHIARRAARQLPGSCRATHLEVHLQRQSRLLLQLAQRFAVLPAGDLCFITYVYA